MHNRSDHLLDRLLLVLTFAFSVTLLSCGVHYLQPEFLANQHGKFEQGSDGKQYVSFPQKWAKQLQMGTPILAHQNDNNPVDVYQISGSFDPKTGLIPVTQICKAPSGGVAFDHLDASFPSATNSDTRSRCLGIVSEQFLVQTPQAVIFNIGQQEGVLKHSRYQLLQDYSSLTNPQNQVFCTVFMVEMGQAHCMLEKPLLPESAKLKYALLKELTPTNASIAKNTGENEQKPTLAEETSAKPTTSSKPISGAESTHSTELTLTAWTEPSSSTPLPTEKTNKNRPLVPKCAISGFAPGEAASLYSQGAIFAMLPRGETTDHQPQAYFQLAHEPKEEEATVPIQMLCQIKDPNIQVTIEEGMPIEWQRTQPVSLNPEKATEGNTEPKAPLKVKWMFSSMHGSMDVKTGHCLSQVVAEKQQKKMTILQLDLGLKEEGYGKVGETYKLIGGLIQPSEALSAPVIPSSPMVEAPLCTITKVKTLLPKKQRNKKDVTPAPGAFDYHRIATCRVNGTIDSKNHVSFENRYAILVTPEKNKAVKPIPVKKGTQQKSH